MSINEDEIRAYLESKKLGGKRIELDMNVNNYDQGSDTTKEEKIGQKNLARAQYIQERDLRMQYGDREAINSYMAEQTELRNRLEEQRYRHRVEYDLARQEEQLKKKLSKITEKDRESEKEDLEKLNRKRDKEVANLRDYFNCTDEFWQEYSKNGHEAFESPAGALITQTDKGTWACDIHRYEKVLEGPDGNLYASTFTLEAVENHFRKDPKPHLEALIEISNRKFDKLIAARKEKTLEDPDTKFKKDLRQIDSIKTRTPGDMTTPAKLSKNQRATIRRQEKEEQDKNRRIYGGLY